MKKKTHVFGTRFMIRLCWLRSAEAKIFVRPNNERYSEE